MPSPDVLRPAPMSRIAVLAPPEDLRAALVEVADNGVVQLDAEADVENDATAALRSMAERATTAARVTRTPVDAAVLARGGRRDLLQGEVDIARHAAPAVTEDGLSALLGWMPAAGVQKLGERLLDGGAALVELPHPRWQEPPTLLPSGPVSDQLRPLVDLYGAVPYADVNPAPFAAVTFVLMFGMMFADAGHGLILVAAGMWARLSRQPRAPSLRRVWLYLVACGLTASVVGAAFGEFFGPTHVIPVLWLAPLEQPLRVIAVAVGIGAALLAASYVLGTVNRFREAGMVAAITSGSGVAGFTLFAGATVAAGGLVWSSTALLWLGVGAAVAGLFLLVIGLYAETQPGAGALPEVAVGAFDAVLRVGSNVISFTRLAAFGLVHAAIGALVWQQTEALWGHGFAADLGAVLVFLLGNVIAFALEGLVVGVQALRLEYYELFSRVFAGQGRRFTPWHLPAVSEELPT
ncbi:MAG TPA: V-type ATPase 116kDa subunit family protein [Candidatus Deferrimicrobium sp.]|nr:V-type ATPase 116kDa subunit family protein [Candidatus Deferrimicrobium sp.]